MKYMIQIGVISTIAFVGEVLHFLLPLPIPASVYGMAILFLFLCLGVIKMEMVEDVADWILSVMPIFFIAPTVGLIEAFGDIKGQVIPLVLICFISTVVVTSVTGIIAQGIIRLRNEKKGGEENE
ncbi:MAG: CidA/LrgA family protein [Agathobacter sp.]|nr:CidA/LrgA family protein [Agathobacter sp.]